MNKRTLSLGFAIATTIMLIVPIELSDNAKASTCSFSSSAAHGSLSFHASFTAPGSCSIGAATSQTLFTALGTGGFKSTVPVTLQVRPMQGVKLKDKTVVFNVLPSLEYVR